jgi:hypothetical protein
MIEVLESRSEDDSRGISDLGGVRVTNTADDPHSLGPSVEHVIRTHPGVVDLLLSFAHAGCSTQTRMEYPLHLQ